MAEPLAAWLRNREVPRMGRRDNLTRPTQWIDHALCPSYGYAAQPQSSELSRQSGTMSSALVRPPW